MTFNRRSLNIFLLLIAVCQVIVVGWLFYRQQLPDAATMTEDMASPDSVKVNSDMATTISDKADSVQPQPLQPEAAAADQKAEQPTHEMKDVKVISLKTADITTMGIDHPFVSEAKKVLSGRLEAADSANRREILNYCEHFRMAYNTRDIDFLRQVFSDNALIIVGQVVKAGTHNRIAYSDKIKYYIRSKHEYLERLKKIFDSGKKIDVDFSDFKILRHPTIEGIYGVTLFQKYSAGDYSDEGNLFLLWDFRNPAMPEIHVRTWQAGIVSDDEKIDISDFNLD